MILNLIALFSSFVLSLVLMPLIIQIFKKKKASQTVLNYVEEHKEKNGTLTMGGVVFIISTLTLAFVFLRFDVSWFVCLLVAIFFGVLGFMDDHIKIKYKQNLGLRPYQKIIGQLGLSIIFAVFIYFFSGIKGQIFLPFSFKMISIGWGVIPLVVLVLIATSNSVNLTDGLDGLAGSVSFVYFIIFTIITCIIGQALYLSGETGEIINKFRDINILNMLFAGSVLAFLLFNTNKACIFMGDVGSLCLGGYIGASSCIVGLEFILPILAICFMFSTISVIMQVAYFKATKKRIFKMAPFHHHLTRCGLSEAKVVQIYATTTLIVGVISIIFYLL